MTFTWYAHLKELGHKPWMIAALISWGIACFEYLPQVPANRIGYTVLSVAQLKILQEVITLTRFYSLCAAVSEGTAKTGLFVGGFMHGGCGLFYFPGAVTGEVAVCE